MRKELRILILEDVAEDALLIERELRKAQVPLKCLQVASREEFLSALNEFQPSAILSDYSLPQFDALGALRLMQEQQADLPFILVTGSQSEEVAVSCIKEGADDYILKSSLTRLPSALLGALQKRRAEREMERATQALRRSEEHFRALIENASDIITVIDPNGIIRFESPSLERILGYEPAELLGKDVFELIHPEDVPSVRRSLAEALAAEGATASIEYRFRHKDGRWRVLESMGKNLLADPEVMGVVANSRDVTERKRAEEQIREQAALLDKARDAIFVQDLNHCITFWNRSAEELYGWTAGEAVGRRMEELLGSGEGEAVAAASRAAIEKSEWQGELTQTAKSGAALVVESSWTLVSDQEGKPKSLLVINTDVTEKKKLAAQFLRAQRLESIGTLAGGIAHDLNNVLTPVTVAIRLLREEITSPPAVELLDTLETSVHRGAGIVQQVLSFARGAEGERALLQVKHPLSEVVSIIRETFPRTIQVQLKLQQDLHPVMGDPTQLHQVFMNLCVNARDAMLAGGRLQVEANNVDLDENYARMQPEAHAGPYVLVSFSDTGGGIPQHLLTSIFEPFFTTKEVGKGTGLGLSTALGLIRSHGGFINVYSEPGKGSRFNIYLPAIESSAAGPGDAAKADVPRGAGEVVLVADDEAAIREVVRLSLEAHGYSVITATDGAEAVAVCAEQKGRIRAALVDLMMPYMDGVATIRAINKIDPRIGFVAMSGLMDSDRPVEVPDVQRIRHLSKPFTAEQVLISLRVLLDQQPTEAPAEPQPKPDGSGNSS